MHTHDLVHLRRVPRLLRRRHRGRLCSITPAHEREGESGAPLNAARHKRRRRQKESARSLSGCAAIGAHTGWVRLSRARVAPRLEGEASSRKERRG
jgi:hypothetical protein